MMVRRKKIQSKGPSMPKENGHFHLENIAYASQRLTIARGEIENYDGSDKLSAVKRKSNSG